MTIKFLVPTKNGGSKIREMVVSGGAANAVRRAMVPSSSGQGIHLHVLFAVVRGFLLYMGSFINFKKYLIFIW